ncbi:MAG: ornithine carbamoyltransferase [Acidiferrobacterales bacterium]
MTPRHFLSLRDLSGDEIRRLVKRACELKEYLKRGERYEPLRGKTLALIFEKSSTRTRVSFETGMNQLGGGSLFLSPRDSHLGRGEPIEDTARVLSRMVDAIVIRTHAHTELETFAAHSNVPVINALTDKCHPCQLLADVQTYIERRGDIKGSTVAWIGDGNNVCHSWMNAAALLDFQLHIAAPAGYEPDSAVLDACRGHVTLSQDPNRAAHHADIVVTDAWTGMGYEEEKAKRERDFAGFTIDENIMSLAKPDAMFMHCLPAYRGQEVAAEVIDGPQSVVWDEAENRLHSQKALLELLFAVRS